MTDLASNEAELVLVDVDSALVDTVGGVDRLVAAWLLGFGSVHTRRAYSADITSWLAFCADHKVDPLTNVRRSHIDAWARTLEAADYRPRTIARKIASVSSWYRFLVDEEVRLLSPVQHVRRPSIGDRGETPGLSRDELRRLLGAAAEHGSPRTVALLQLLATTGVSPANPGRRAPRLRPRPPGAQARPQGRPWRSHRADRPCRASMSARFSSEQPGAISSSNSCGLNQATTRSLSHSLS